VEGDQGERVTILEVGRATLEIANPAQVAMIDEVEVGRRVSPRLRVAFEVSVAMGVTADLVGGGAELLGGTDRDAVAVAEFAVVGAGGSADHGVRGAGRQGWVLTGPTVTSVSLTPGDGGTLTPLGSWRGCQNRSIRQ